MTWDAIFFDLDDTLYSREDAFVRTTKRFAEEFLAPGTEVDFDAVQTVVASRISGESKGVGQDRHWQLVFEIIKEQHPDIQPGATELVKWYRDQLISQMKPDPGLQPVLDHLDSTGTPYAIVTNGDLFQLRKIDRLGLEIPRERIIMSDVEGARKPDPAIFATAIERLSLPPDARMLMIGDNPVADIIGASAVGMSTAWMKMGRKWEPTDFQPDISLDSLGELIHHL